MRGVIFDMDGVVVDTEKFHNIALKQQKLRDVIPISINNAANWRLLS